MKSFNKKYRQLLSQNAPQAPDDVWKNVSSQLDMDAAKMRLDTEEEELIDAVWAGLEDQLDVDEVWGSISGELDKADVKRAGYKLKFPYWAAAAILLLLLMGDTGLVQFLGNSMHPNYVADVQTQHSNDSLNIDVRSGSEKPLGKSLEMSSNSHQISAIGNSIASSSDLSSSKKSGNFVIPKSTTKGLKVPIGNKEPQSSKNSNKLLARASAGEAIIGDDSPQQQSFNRHAIELSDSVSGAISHSYLSGKDALIASQQEFKPELKPMLSDVKTIHDYILEDFDLPQPKDEKPALLASSKNYSPWSAGVVTSIKNTYLLNAETKDGFSPSGMNESKITILPDIGLNVQYAISQRYTLSSNIFLSSTSKQNYNTYSYGEYVSKQLKLNYLAGEFAVKQSAKNNILNSDKIIRRNILGVYIASLQSASETLVTEKSDISSKYTALDYGLLLGQEIEFVSRGPIRVSAGLTVKYGLPNVYAGDSSLPGNMNQTHNASFEFRVGIAYRWKTNRGFDHYLSLLTGK